MDDVFVQKLNQNLCIAHKVCRLYFAGGDERGDVLQEMMYQLCRSYRSFDGRSKFSTIILFLPFTVILMQKFKRMAITKPEGENTEISLRHYVQRQHTLLQSFYTFKRRYELILTPLSAAIGVFLTFQLYVPGGVMAYQTSAMVIFVITLISCALAIIAENRKSFEQPLHDLRKLIEEFKLNE